LIQRERDIKRVRTATFVVAAWLRVIAAQEVFAQSTPQFRPPAVPLITHNPYFSIWSMSDRLTDDTTRHWTNKSHALWSLIRVDGMTFRLMDKEPASVPPLTQTSLQVTPTRTIYGFRNNTVQVTLTFMTAALTDNMDILARPVTYIAWSVKSADGKPHRVSIFAGASSQIAVNLPEQEVVCKREHFGVLAALRAGTSEQPMLQQAGDDTRIDWGYLYLAAPAAHCRATIGSAPALFRQFSARGALTSEDDQRFPRRSNDDEPNLGLSLDLGTVRNSSVSRHIMLAYDEIYSINFLGRKLRPYWRRNGAGPAELLAAAEREYSNLVQRCENFDRDMMADLTRQGGARYAQMAALAYRQAIAGCGWAADANKQPLIFTKENTSNGCIATTDVFYPAAPLFLMMGPAYAKALIAPVLVYSASEQWKFPFAPHDIGVYPQATAQAYGGGEAPGNEGDKMPVEESANMILLCDAIAKMEGNARFASRWWQEITKWEAYLERYGLDPENQLCTDDFMGHLAHNANLSVKAILAIAAYGELCRLRGDMPAYRKYVTLARADAAHWIRAAKDGDHYRIAFDRPGTWSQKYNLVWDRILGLNVFPAEVARKETAWYKRVIQKFGVPLDSRTKLTKTDWTVWSATLADSSADFRAIVEPTFDYLNHTTARQPFVDSYLTDNIRSDGMHARPVIGGVFIKMLADPIVWKTWASRDITHTSQWAISPNPPLVTEIIPTTRLVPAAWRYTTTAPRADWCRNGFDDSAWPQGASGFGTRGTPGAIVNTVWNTGDIWLRRQIAIPQSVSKGNLQFLVYHDEDVEIYVNGMLAAKRSGYTTAYQPVEISASVLKILQPGAMVTIAVHCHQTGGGQGVDVGIANITER
jgi:hypothetical protein